MFLIGICVNVLHTFNVLRPWVTIDASLGRWGGGRGR